MLADLYLGRAELESPTPGLQLQLSSSAKFAPSAEDELDALQSRLTACRVYSDSDLHPWISRGSNYKLFILLELQDVLDSRAQAAVIERLSTQLESAKVAIHHLHALVRRC